MKPLLLLITDTPALGGVAEYNMSLLKGLVASNYCVIYVQPHFEQCQSDFEEFKKLGIECFLIDNSNVETSLADAERLFDRCDRLPNLAIFSNSNPMANLLLKQVILERNIPYLMIEGLVEPELARDYPQYLAAVEKHYKSAKEVIAVSRDNLNLLRQYFKLSEQQGRVIYSGRPSRYFTPIDSSLRQQLRQSREIPLDAVVSFTSARLESRKGYQYQIQAIEKLKNCPAWSQLYFVWAGTGIFSPQFEGELKQAISNLGVSDRVKFLGQVSNVDEWLNAVDIFVFPSRAEGMPFSIMEAMAKGLPVIATAVNGIPEELGETGQLLTDPNRDPLATVEELASTLERWTQNAELRRAIGRACQERAENLFREERMVNDLIQAISGVLSADFLPDRNTVKELMQQAINDLKTDSLKALHTIEKAISFDIFVPKLYYIHALCLCHVGRNEEGLEAAQKELELNPSDRQTQQYIQALKHDLGRLTPQEIIPTHLRSWDTALPAETMYSIQKASHNYTYRGIPTIKNPFDFALYPLLLWQIKPRTILEIGSKNGGSALWLGDLLDTFYIDGHIYSIDIVKVTSVSHPRVTFLEGNGRNLSTSLSGEFLNNLPRPFLIIEDADHAYETSYSVLNFFHAYLKVGEYIIIEDGMISNLTQDRSFNSGPHKATKQFLKEHSEEYEIDSHYCDFFGYNFTWCTNGYLKKVANLTASSTPDKTPDRIVGESPFKVIVDGVFFQRYNTGIARVWSSLLEEWGRSDFAKYILVLDRGGTLPKIPGIRSRTIALHDYNNLDGDRALLQEICDREGANIFISTYYSFPLSTPSVFLAHDMIPELLKANLQDPMWQEKHEAIKYASAYIAVSKNTARDLKKFYPDIETVTIAHNGVAKLFSPATKEESDRFKYKYGISKPYFLLVAPGMVYKNARLFFQAFAQLPVKQGFELVCTVRGGFLEEELRNLVPGTVIHTLSLSNEELRLAYCAAIAMIYPSRYEGFGLPVLEALACGCPVITTPCGPMPEVAEDAAIYVEPDDTVGMTEALCEVQKPRIRQQLIEKGLARSKAFSWQKMAKTLSSVLIATSLNALELREINAIAFPDWQQPEEELILTLQQCIRQVATHRDRDRITLLIHTENVSEEDANLLLSGAAMNLLMEEDINVSEALNIVLTGQLSSLQWNILLPRLTGKMTLPHENQAAIARVGANILPPWNESN